MKFIFSEKWSKYEHAWIYAFERTRNVDGTVQARLPVQNV